MEDRHAPCGEETPDGTPSLRPVMSLTVGPNVENLGVHEVRNVWCCGSRLIGQCGAIMERRKEVVETFAGDYLYY